MVHECVDGGKDSRPPDGACIIIGMSAGNRLPRKPVLRLIGVGHLLDAALRFPAIESNIILCGIFLVARRAYACQLLLIVVGLYAGVALLRQKPLGRSLAMGLDILAISNAVLVLLIPGSRERLQGLGTRIGLSEETALFQMAFPYLVHGFLHAISLGWLLTNKDFFQEAPVRPSGGRRRRPSSGAAA